MAQRTQSFSSSLKVKVPDPLFLMLEYEEALARVLAKIPPPLGETIPLSEACGRVLLRDAVAHTDLPPFDNSAMDGYALHSQDVVQGAKPDAPVSLRVAGKVAAGEVFPGEIVPGTCVRIFTGSPLPRGTDAVVMQEDTRVAPERPEEVLILEGVKPWENVRFRGEDVKAGATLVRAGEKMTAGRLALLAAAGASPIEVGRQPRLALIATGTELREPGQPLQPGQIYESNRSTLAILARSCGGIPQIFPLVSDSFSETRQALDTALCQCDLVVTSGGVSVGEMDFVKSALEATGGEVQFWKVAIKPGRPFVFGCRKDKLLFGLPGNPVSAFVTFLLLVRPALLRWQGALNISPGSSPGLLAEPLANPGARRHFMRVRVDAKGEVYSAGVQASHVMSSLAAANGLVDVSPKTSLPAGTRVQVLQWE